MIDDLWNRGKNLQEQIVEMRYDDQPVFKTPQQNMVAANTLLDSITPLIKDNKALALAIRRINAALTVAIVQEQAHISAGKTELSHRITQPE